MLILGIDPGPTASGWAVLELVSPGPACVLACGHGSADEVLEVMAANAVEVCAVEWTAGFYRVGHGDVGVGRSLGQAKQLVATALVAGELAGFARGIGRKVVRPTAAEVRRALVGNRQASDAQVAGVLAHLVALPKRSSVHARDAMAAAIVGARMVA